MTACGAIAGIPMSVLQLGISAGSGAQGAHMWEGEHQEVLWNWSLGEHQDAHRCDLGMGLGMCRKQTALNLE